MSKTKLDQRQLRKDKFIDDVIEIRGRYVEKGMKKNVINREMIDEIMQAAKKHKLSDDEMSEILNEI
jgi:hypothetical protein